MLNIVFMGTPDFAKDSLEAIYNAGHNILAVVTNPDKPKGRGMKMIASPVKEYAIEHNLQVFQPITVRKNEEFIEQIRNLKPDIICVVAYGKILPKDILDIPPYGCVNVHASLLPKYRGAAPIQWAVLNGEKETGVTTMYMDIGMDTGDMILTSKVSIGEDETTGELWNRLSKIGGKLLCDTLEQIENKTVTRTPQGEDYTLAPMLSKEIAEINWDNKTSQEIKNLVRGLNPIMGAYTTYKDKKIKFWKVEVVKECDIDQQGKDPGQILVANDKQGLYVKTTDGVIKVIEIQGENSKRMNICDFLRGNKLEVNEIFN
jgi:methionyl-tRNA formyltransferase